jgi:tetrapyrrole methylase family protein/MazG family protein
MEIFPDDYEVTVGHNLGMQGEEIRKVPLYELDRLSGYGNYSLIYVPRTSDGRVLGRTFNRLRDIVRILRSPEGCPWDREQTHQSIRKNLLEETYELLETIDNDDPDAMCEELGDVLLQVMLHAQMEEERGAFHIIDVIAGLNDKLIRRHPHVFGGTKAQNAEEALNSWQRMKLEEKKQKGQADDSSSVLDGVPRSLPELMKAWEYQKKAAKVGFDWDKLEDVFAKVDEEIGELKQAVQEGRQQECREELGDLLFAVVNAARFLGIDPEEALAGTNRKFLQRFSYIEQQLRLKGKSFDQTSLPEMEEWWQQAKRL